MNIQRQQTASWTSTLVGAAEAEYPEMDFLFPEGLPGLEGARNFLLVPNELALPFLYFDCQDRPDLGFFCIDPFLVDPDYRIRISDVDQEFLDLRDPEQALILVTVTLASDPSDFTANLLAPLVMNLERRQGRQIIQEGYPLCYRLADALERLGAA